MNQIRFVHVLLLCLGSFFASGCSTTDFTVLVDASQKMDVQVATLKKTFQASPPAKQLQIRNQIIAGRQKALIWAQRMNVQSIPQVANKTMTYDAGSALKQRWVAAALKNLEAATAMPIPDVEPISPNADHVLPNVEPPSPKK